ncbi:hypothetical protein Bbelb_202660 [Branchiostoma belcheri]|nr:hypothetical protein Bbelb_202660 [Branchiostoma belcheri]
MGPITHGRLDGQGLLVPPPGCATAGQRGAHACRLVRPPPGEGSIHGCLGSQTHGADTDSVRSARPCLTAGQEWGWPVPVTSLSTSSVVKSAGPVPTHTASTGVTGQPTHPTGADDTSRQTVDNGSPPSPPQQD